MSEWVFDFAWKSPPLHLNQRLHHMAKAKLTAELRAMMHAKARHLPTLEKCSVVLIWYVSDRRRRDAENPVATLKVLCDALVDAEVVDDDIPEKMTKFMPIITYRPGQPASMQLIVKDIGEQNE